MKLFEAFLVSAILMRSICASPCNDIYLVNMKNLPAKRCMVVGKKVNGGNLIEMANCADVSDQKFTINYNAGTFSIEHEDYGKAYLRKQPESQGGELNDPGRLRIQSSSNNNHVRKFVYDGHNIEPDDFEDYCLTGYGARQDAGKRIIVLQCEDKTRYDWFFTESLTTLTQKDITTC